jgi:hypothetical protein
MRLATVACVAASLVMLVGCVGSPVHSTMQYNSIQSKIVENNDRLLMLRVGMLQTDVLGVMGKPERSEGYSWGSAWLYRTAMTSGIYGTADSDFTPVVIGPDGALAGWGRNYFTDQAKKYEFRVTQ